jgi:flagellar biosynthesis/type III secretory pathway M-ring protein FliF/YscJ
MDAIRRSLDTITRQLGRLGPTERVLIGSFVVILIMGLFLVSQYTGKPSMVELLPGVPLADQQKAQAFLSTSGITTENQAGKLMIAVDQKDRAMAILTANKQLPADTSGFFQTILSAQSWSNTRQQNEQIYNAALKAELDKIVSTMPGIKSASVLFDVPEASGIGSSVRRPTASVAVFTESGSPLEQKTVDAIAYLVGGAKAGLGPDRVRVIDGSGRQRKTTSESDIIPTTYLEHAMRVENETQRKISELLSHIPGVVVTVTAQVDVTRVTSREQKYLPIGEGSVSAPKRASETTTKQYDGSKGAEAGVRSNQPMDINRGSARGNSNENEQTEKDTENHVGSRIAETVDPRGMPTMVAVSVNVPRGFIAAMLKGPDGKGTADDAGIAAAFAKMSPEIKNSIVPHVRAMTQAAGGTTVGDPADQVVVSLTPVDTVLAPVEGNQAGLFGGFVGGGGGGGGAVLMGMSLSQVIDKAVLALLGLGALGFMFVMVKKAGKKPDLPTAEELVGLPPAIESPSDLIGEADETDTPMAGIELGEGDVRTTKLLEQVTDLVKSNPEGTAKLLKRWVSVEE